MPAEVEAQLKRLAEEQTRTLAGQILHYVLQGIKNDDDSRN